MRTKIVATLGPASNSSACIRTLITEGVDVFRLNFSHGDHAEHGRVLREIRRQAKALGASVCVLQDLQGPKIRTGKLKSGGQVYLETGRKTAITTRAIVGTAACFPTSYRALPGDVGRGDRILLDDGLLELRVTSVKDDTVNCRVVVGGPLREHKGINLPGVQVSAPALTPKDRRDLAFGLEAGVDAVALSFVRRASDIEALRRAVRRAGHDTPIIAKIEKPEAVAELDAILDAADGVMVARGDLGVEMAPERVPVLQKQIILKANRLGKPVIVATQMLESMIHSPRPTRAEASDVANAIFDMTDAVMLSGETAVGDYPVEAVTMMTRIAEAAEEVVRKPHEEWGGTLSVAAAVADAAVHAASESAAAALVVFTLSGSTARLLAQRRPACPIHAFSPTPIACRRLAMVWGVQPRPIAMARTVGRLSEDATQALLAEGAVKKGDTLVLVAGETPAPGSTNIMKVMTV